MNDGNQKVYTITPKIGVRITAQDIDDIMNIALDSIGYWCGMAEVSGEYLGEYASDQISHGGTLILHDAESDDTWELTLDKLLKGIRLAIEQGAGSGFTVDVSDGSIDIGDVDGEIADMIIQLALFGEVVFG